MDIMELGGDWGAGGRRGGDRMSPPSGRPGTDPGRRAVWAEVHLGYAAEFRAHVDDIVMS